MQELGTTLVFWASVMIACVETKRIFCVSQQATALANTFSLLLYWEPVVLATSLETPIPVGLPQRSKLPPYYLISSFHALGTPCFRSVPLRSSHDIKLNPNEVLMYNILFSYSVHSHEIPF